MNKSEIAVMPRAAVPLAGIRARWAVTAMLLIAVTTAFFDRINVSVLFANKDFQSDIGVSDPALMGLLMTAFVFPYGLSAMAFSICGDYFGPRKTLSAIAALLAVIMSFIGSVSSYGLIFAARVALGITEGPQFGSAIATVKRWFPPREQGFANAVWTVGSPLGSAIGIPLSFFLVAQYGWRASFYVLAALNACIVLPMIWLFLRDRPENAPADTQAERFPFAAAFAVFAREPKFWLIVFYDCGVMIYLWGLNAWLPTYLQQERHFDIAHAGIYSALPFIMMFLGELACAWLGDRTGRRAAVCGGALFLTGLFIYFASIVPDALTAVWCISFSAFFWGGTTPTLFALGCDIIPAKVTAAGFGIYAGIANTVGSSSPAIMGVLVGQTGDFTAGFQFLVASCFVSSFAMIPLMRKH